MMSKKSVITGFIVVLLSPVALWFLASAAGFYIDDAGWHVAKLIVERGGAVDDCNKIVSSPLNWFGPPTGARRMDCKHQYAELMKDPTACASLLPHRYGWSCLGVATDGRPCSFDAGSTRKIGGAGIVTTLDKCITGPDDIRNNECCIAARITFTDTDESCDLITGRRDIKDQCNHNVAKNDRDLDHCNTINNENLRIACQVGVEALLSQE